MTAIDGKSERGLKWVLGGVSVFILLAGIWFTADWPGAFLFRAFPTTFEWSIGTWWMAMLAMASAMLALALAIRDWAVDRAASWALAGLALLGVGLAIDEMGSMHERAEILVPLSGHLSLLPAAIPGILILVSSLVVLFRRRKVYPGLALGVTVAYLLFGSVYIQEVIEHRYVWAEWFQPIRGAIEEGTELVGVMLLVLSLAGRQRRQASEGRPAVDIQTGLRALSIAVGGLVLLALPLILIRRLMPEEGYRGLWWGDFGVAPLVLIFAATAGACALRARRGDERPWAWWALAITFLLLSLECEALLKLYWFNVTWPGLRADVNLLWGIPLVALFGAAIPSLRSWWRLGLVAQTMVGAVAVVMLHKDPVSLTYTAMTGGMMFLALIPVPMPARLRQPSTARESVPDGRPALI